MVHDTASLESANADRDQPSVANLPARGTPLPLPLLLLSVPLIAIGALATCCIVAIATVLVLYAQGGADGVSDFYQELRFDLPLKTQINAFLVSALYVGTALTTIGAAALYGRRKWADLVAFTRIAGGQRAIAALFAVTLTYAAVVTLVMALQQDHRLVISGPTDILLLGAITANLVVLAPCAEELFFRGWLYTGLRHRLSFWPSFLVTASLFAAIHWDASHRRIFLVLPLAVALGLLREMTGSIKPTIALHAVYNLVIVTITLLET